MIGSLSEGAFRKVSTWLGLTVRPVLLQKVRLVRVPHQLVQRPAEVRVRDHCALEHPEPDHQLGHGHGGGVLGDQKTERFLGDSEELLPALF